MGEREYIAGKRSGIRRRANGPEKSNKDIITGAVILTIVFILIFSVYSASDKISDVPEKAVAQTPAQTPASTIGPGATLLSTPEPEGKPFLVSIAAPRITLLSPQDITYNSSFPELDFRVIGAGLDTVLFSVDDKANVTIPNDGSIVEINLQGLRGFWNFDENANTTVFDASGNNNVGTIYGAEWADGKFNSALSFDGVDNYVEVHDSNSLDVTQITVLAWIKTGSTTAVHTLIAKGNYNNGWALSYRGSDDKIEFPYYNGNTWDNIISNTISIEDDNWHHVAVVLDSGVPSASIYVDGKDVGLSDSPSITGLATTAFPVTIGRRVDGQYFNDLIDEVMIFNHALSEGEVVLLYSSDYGQFSDGQHYITIFANNSIGNTTFITRYFTVNTTDAPTEPKTYGIGDTITKGSLAVTLNHYSPIEDITYPSSGTGKYTAAHITIENVGKVENSITLDAKTVLLDNIGNQYIFKKLSRDDEIVQGTLYPRGKKSGTLYFTPAMSAKAKKVKLIVKIGEEKYEFEFKAF